MQPELFFPQKAFAEVRSWSIDEIKKLSILSEMIRRNALSIIMYAGSGHIGATLSAADFITLLYYKIMKVDPKNPCSKNRDVFILSKGHAVPALYAALASLNFFSNEKLYTFRRLGGLQGHPEMIVPGIDANTGSLGMGLSKAEGHAIEFKKMRLPNRAFVMVGDGELQEGQNWETIGSAPSFKLENLVMLVDQNKFQTDRRVQDILVMPPIENKLSASGWQVEKVSGHDLSALLTLVSRLDYNNNKPKAIILQTIKGKGVSFMEADPSSKERYVWHAKIPNQEEFERAIREIDERIKKLIPPKKLPTDFFPTIPTSFSRPKINWSKLSVVDGFGKGVFEMVGKNKNIVVLDADLVADCGTGVVEERYPDNFLELGIAEQNMVSIAGALANQGLLPIVNTYAAFLTSRTNEQIFNNQSEGAKVIYVGHLAGVIPATPGKSHSGVRDIALMRTIPGLVLCEPSNTKESYLLIKYLISEIKGSSYLRLAGCKGLGEIKLPSNYKVSLGEGAILREGRDIALISYGPILLPQVLAAADLLSKKGIEAKVIDLPWFNFIDVNWLAKAVGQIDHLVTVDDHMVGGGQGEEILKLINQHPSKLKNKVTCIGIEGFTESGQVLETLRHHGLDGDSLASRIQKMLKT